MTARRMAGAPAWLSAAGSVALWLALAPPIVRAQLAAWAIVRHDPDEAFRLAPSDARALAGRAVAAQLSGRRREAITLARSSIAREPVNVAALRTLGLALDQQGDHAGADRLFELAGSLGWRDAALQYILLRMYARQGDVASVLQRADALARTNQLPEVAFPVFFAAIKTDDARLALATEMADRPFWRGAFFYRVLDRPEDEMPFIDRLVADLARVGSPITPAETSIYLARKVQLGQARDALSYWRRANGVGDGSLVWDGGFERVPARDAPAAPFEWRLSPQSVGVASVAPAGSGGRRMVIEAGHDVQGSLASQTIVLPPGRYRIDAKVAGDAAAMGLRWSLRCAADRSELPAREASSDRPLTGVTFDVPAGCGAQDLSLELASDGGSAAARVAVDGVSIRRES